MLDIQVRRRVHYRPGALVVSPASPACSPLKSAVAPLGPIFKFWLWGLRQWYILTFFMGAVFVGGQINEYTNYVKDHFAGHGGMTISSSAYGTVFFLTTGFHGLHVTGGLVAFVFLLARSSRWPVHSGAGHQHASSCRTTGTSSTSYGSVCSSMIYLHQVIR